jgi:plasmid stabilization system protein ParE
VKLLRFTADARAEFLAEVAYYNEAAAGLGDRFTEAVEEASALALAFPLAGSPSDANTRRVFTKGSPFSIIYRPEGEGVVVFAIAHNARKPGYWRSRLQNVQI